MYGSVMVEFAGAFVLLVLLVFGISEIGRAIYQLNTLTKAVESGARYMSRYVGAVTFDPTASTPQQQCTINSTAWDVAVSNATNIVLYGTETTGGSARLPNMVVNSITVEPRLDTGLSDGGACVITIKASAAFASLFGDYIIPTFYSSNGGQDSIYKGLVLTAQAQERYIGE
jgi:hypothetical protein